MGVRIIGDSIDLSSLCAFIAATCRPHVTTGINILHDAPGPSGKLITVVYSILGLTKAMKPVTRRYLRSAGSLDPTNPWFRVQGFMGFRI